MKFKITLLLLITAMGYGQVTNQGKPASWKLSNLQQPATITMPRLDVKVLENEDTANEALGTPWRFAKEFEVNYTLQNSGTWTNLANGDRIWRLHVSSAGAKAIHFWFRNFYLPEGASVYVYNNDHSDMMGAFDSRQNKGSDYFGTWPLTGDSMWVEYYEPQSQIGQGRLELFKVGHSYRPFFNTVEEPGLTTFSAECNFDVECFVEGIDNLKNITKRSITRMLFSGAEGTFACTGALINTTANDGTPYILSANHCYIEDAFYMYRFNWINPFPACPSNGTGDGSINEFQVISGSELKARKTESDFMLQELSQDIPAEWNVIWSGWNRTTSVPPYTYGVHHPAGDIMKVSLDTDPPSSITDPDGGKIWEIGNLELGTLEGGSSGSPLLDNNGRIRGQAWYIFGTTGFGCSGDGIHGSIGVGYGRLNVSWDAGATPQSRLKEWLDPGNTGATTVDFFPPVQIADIDARAGLFEPGNDLCAGTISPSIRLINYGQEPLTSAQITYSLNGEEQVINWTGNLAENESSLIEFPFMTGIPGQNTFVVTIENPNGTEDEDTSNNSVSYSFAKPVHYEVNAITLNLTTDDFGSETSWDLTNASGEVLYSSDNLDSTTEYTEEFNLPLAGCYTFKIYDVVGDGICCQSGQGHFSLNTPDGGVIGEGADFGTSRAVSFIIEENLGTVNQVQDPGLRIYPNPSSGVFTIASGKELSGEKYEVYNIVGQVIKSGYFGSEAVIDISHATNGIYLLKLSVSANKNTTTFKLLKE
jgi:hypothetical protein